MNCPHCEKELEILPRCHLNVDNYGRSVIARTECCKNLVHMRPTKQVEITPYKGDRTEDDWGMQTK